MTTIREGVLQIIDKYQRAVGEYDGPFELTNTGLSLALDRGRPVVCAELARMMREGVLIYTLRHVPGAKQKRRLYLRPDMFALADQKKSDWAKLHSELQQISYRLHSLEGVAERLRDTPANSTDRR